MDQRGKRGLVGVARLVAVVDAHGVVAGGRGDAVLQRAAQVSALNHDASVVERHFGAVVVADHQVGQGRRPGLARFDRDLGRARDDLTDLEGEAIELVAQAVCVIREKAVLRALIAVVLLGCVPTLDRPAQVTQGVLGGLGHDDHLGAGVDTRVLRGGDEEGRGAELLAVVCALEVVEHEIGNLGGRHDGLDLRRDLCGGLVGRIGALVGARVVGAGHTDVLLAVVGHGRLGLRIAQLAGKTQTQAVDADPLGAGPGPLVERGVVGVEVGVRREGVRIGQEQGHAQGQALAGQQLGHDLEAVELVVGLDGGAQVGASAGKERGLAIGIHDHVGLDVVGGAIDGRHQDGLVDGTGLVGRVSDVEDELEAVGLIVIEVHDRPAALGLGVGRGVVGAVAGGVGRIELGLDTVVDLDGLLLLVDLHAVLFGGVQLVALVVGGMGVILGAVVEGGVVVLGRGSILGLGEGHGGGGGIRGDELGGGIRGGLRQDLVHGILRLGVLRLHDLHDRGGLGGGGRGGFLSQRRMRGAQHDGGGQSAHDHEGGDAMGAFLGAKVLRLVAHGGAFLLACISSQVKR